VSAPSTVEKGRALKTLWDGLWKDHPIFSTVLGICSSLAVTNKVENAVAMGAGVTFCLLATAVMISALRTLIPTRARMIAYMVVIATFVIVVDRTLRALYPDISRAIGPYVGLIITNCILMGRAEAFYIQNNVFYSVLDSLANGIGYSYTLVLLAVIREALAFGTVLGFRVMPGSWTNWVVMAMAPGAFFLISIAIWIVRARTRVEVD
jgi:Na+-transporting NADH:ubiquinone oxidoreductase subunit D